MEYTYDSASGIALLHTFVLWKELPVILSYFDCNMEEVANNINHLCGK